MGNTAKKEMTGSAKIQGELWTKRAKDWAEIQEPKSAPLFESILSNIKSNSAPLKLLDIGCGSGFFCKMAFDEGLDVTGIDASPLMVEEARKRLGIDLFYEGDMENLPFEDNTFDIVAAITSLQFAQDSSKALEEIKRVLKKEGQFVMAIWGPPGQCQAGIIISVLKDLMPPSPKSGSPPAALHEESRLEKFVNENGFKTIRRIDVPFAWNYENSEMVLRAFLSAGPVEIAIRHSGEEKVKSAMMTAMKSLMKDDGSYSITNVFIYVIATK